MSSSAGGSGGGRGGSGSGYRRGNGRRGYNHNHGGGRGRGGNNHNHNHNNNYYHKQKVVEEVEVREEVSAKEEMTPKKGFIVVAYLDHTNINVNSTKAAGREAGFPEGVDDLCTRVVPLKVHEYLEKLHKEEGGEMELVYCYTSDPSVGSHRNIGSETKVLPRVFLKSSWSNKEKIVDTYLVADAVERIGEGLRRALVLGLDPNERPGLMSLFSGDTDILQPVLEKATKGGWDVEVWAFRNSLSRVVEDFPKVRVRYLDDVYTNVTERKMEWKPNPEKTPSPNLSFQLKWRKGSLEFAVAKNEWREVVQLLTGLLKLPLQAWPRWEEATLFVILCVPARILEESMRKVRRQKSEMEEEVKKYLNLRLGSNSAHCNLFIETPGAASAIKKFYSRRNSSSAYNNDLLNDNYSTSEEEGEESEEGDYDNDPPGDHSAAPAPVPALLPVLEPEVEVLVNTATEVKVQEGNGVTKSWSELLFEAFR